MNKYITGTIILVLSTGNVYADSLKVLNPYCRSYACMVNDRMNQRAILFGGGNYRLTGGQYYNDVWSFDFGSEIWQPITISPPVPPSRVMASAAYNSATNEMLVFGGRSSGGGFYNDVWSLDLTQGAESWTQLTTSGMQPTPRSSASAIVDSVNNRLIILYGEAGGPGLNDLYSLDLTALIWLQLFPSGAPPSPRFEHSAIYDPIGHRMIVFGGRNGDHYNDVYALDLTLGSESWQQLLPSGSPPAVRGRHFCVYDDVSYEMAVGFGWNFAAGFVYLNDVWTLDLNSLIWERVFPGNSSLVGRRGSSAAFNSMHRQVVAFGGDQTYHYFAETCILSVDTVTTEEHQEYNVSISPYIKILTNPIRLPCQIDVFIPFPSNIDLKIFDASGRLVNTLLKDKKSSGNYIIQWDGKDTNGNKISAGTYFVNLEMDGESVVKKAVVIE